MSPLKQMMSEVVAKRIFYDVVSDMVMDFILTSDADESDIRIVESKPKECRVLYKEKDHYMFTLLEVKQKTIMLELKFTHEDAKADDIYIKEFGEIDESNSYAVGFGKPLN